MNEFPLKIENFTDDSNVDKIKILSLDTPNAELIYDGYTLKNKDLPVVIPTKDIKDNKLLYYPIGNLKNIQELILHYESQGMRFLKVEDCYLYFSKEVTNNNDISDDDINDIIDNQNIETKVINEMRYADYLVLYYDFTNDNNYTDLDIETSIVKKYDVNQKLGFVPSKRNRSVAVTKTENGYMQWSNDNRQNGVETILFNIKKMKEDDTKFNKLSFSANCQWWQDSNIYEHEGLNPKVSSSPLRIKIVGYEGGTMKLDNNYQWINEGGKKLGQYEFNPIDIRTDRPAIRKTNPNFKEDPKPYNIGTFTFNRDNGEIYLDKNNNDVNIKEASNEDLIIFDNSQGIIEDKYKDPKKNINLNLSDIDKDIIKNKKYFKIITINTNVCESNITYVLSYQDSVNYCEHPIKLQVLIGKGESMLPNWQLTGEHVCSILEDKIIPVDINPVWEEVSEDCAETKDKYNNYNSDSTLKQKRITYYFEKQKDINPASPTFNQIRWIRNKDKNSTCN